MEIITVYTENHKKCINAKCTVPDCGTYSSYWALTGLMNSLKTMVVPPLTPKMKGEMRN
jgi:hypothetical protein